MDLSAVLRRIAERGAALSLSESAISGRAGSKDMIRNWRRSVESGTPLNVKLASLDAVARELGVTTEWLIRGEGPQERPGRPPADRASGFSDQAVPFTFPVRPADPQGPQPALAAVFGPGSLAGYRIAVDLPAFSLCAGDVLVADMSRLPTTGELAVARLIDEGDGTAQTLVVRYLPPFLPGGRLASDANLWRIDQPGMTVRFPVIGSIRGVDRA